MLEPCVHAELGGLSRAQWISAVLRVDIGACERSKVLSLQDQAAGRMSDIRRRSVASLSVAMIELSQGLAAHLC